LGQVDEVREAEIVDVPGYSLKIHQELRLLPIKIFGEPGSA
jgi:hypothetical protein